MESRNVPRETKQIRTKDFLVSNKEFVVEEIEKGLLETRPIIQTQIFRNIIIQKSICHIKKGLLFFL